MPHQIVLPDIGEGVVEAEIIRWFVKPGDPVEEDQPLVEVMTDKATVTIPSPKRGRITRLMWKEGDVARVTMPLLEMELETGTAAGPPPARPGAAEMSLGDEARAAVTAGMPEELPSGAGRRRALATPAVRALARELGIDLAVVTGTGAGGRVTKEDLRTRVNGRPARPLAPPPRVPERPGAAAPSGPGSAARAPEGAIARTPQGDVEVVPVRGLRRRIAENVARSKRTAAHFTFVEQVDATELVRVKERMAKAAADDGVKVTFLPFVVKAAVAALRKFPQLNASFDEEKGEIHLKRWYDVGIATATEQGLSVPVLRAADQRSILEAAREIDRLAADTRAGKLRPEDVGGSTFTITSLGALGGLFATPVINHPEVAILGVHRIRPTPVVRDAQIVVRDVMHLSLTSDHRVVDGHQAAAFVYEVIRYLEDPNQLFLQMV